MRATSAGTAAAAHVARQGLDGGRDEPVGVARGQADADAAHVDAEARPPREGGAPVVGGLHGQAGHAPAAAPSRTPRRAAGSADTSVPPP